MNKFATTYAAFMRKIAEDKQQVKPKKNYDSWYNFGKAIGSSGAASAAPAGSASAGAASSSQAPAALSANGHPVAGASVGTVSYPVGTASGAAALPLGTAGAVLQAPVLSAGAGTAGSAASSGDEKALDAFGDGLVSPYENAVDSLKKMDMIKNQSFHDFGTVLGSFMSKMASFDRLVKKAADPEV